MDLLNQNKSYNSKPEKSSGSKMITTLIIVCVILLIIVLALMFYLKSMQAPKRLLNVNGTQMEMAQGVMISDNSGNEYISLKDLSDTIGYKYTLSFSLFLSISLTIARYKRIVRHYVN